MEKILVTGGAGFIGANFVLHMLNKYPELKIVNLDALTYAANLENLSQTDPARHIFVHGNICDKELVAKLFNENEFDYVINFAAESHVDRSITQPDIFLHTNILGTQVLLDAAKNSWKINKDNNNCRLFKSGAKYLQISTDEVYGTLGKEGLFTENTPIAPNSPYSASKAAADLMVRAYSETYGLPINITRCSNNYGRFQFLEKLIPLMITNALNDKSLPIYGDGQQIRDWIFVDDHCEAIDTVLNKGIPGEVYNIGGNCEMANIDAVKQILVAVGKDESLINYVADRPGHDRRYAIDNTKITSKLGWKPRWNFKKGLDATVKWYIKQ